MINCCFAFVADKGDWTLFDKKGIIVSNKFSSYNPKERAKLIKACRFFKPKVPAFMILVRSKGLTNRNIVSEKPTYLVSSYVLNLYDIVYNVVVCSQVCTNEICSEVLQRRHKKCEFSSD